MKPITITSAGRRRGSPGVKWALAAVAAAVLATASLLSVRRGSGKPAQPAPAQDTPAPRPAVVEAVSPETGGAGSPPAAVAPASEARDVKTGVDARRTPPRTEAKRTPATASKRTAQRPLDEQERLRAEYVYPTPGQALTDGGKVVTFHPPPEGGKVTFMADGKTYECYHDGTYKIIEKKPVFEERFEEQLVALATPGATFLPAVLLDHTEEELRQMLARKVVIYDDDPEDVVQKKEAVAEMKKVLSDFLEQGGDYIEFVQEMHKSSLEERNLYRLGLDRLYDIAEGEGGAEEARRFLATYNELLDERGFSPLPLPAKMKKLLEGKDVDGDEGEEDR